MDGFVTSPTTPRLPADVAAHSLLPGQDPRGSCSSPDASNKEPTTRDEIHLGDPTSDDALLVLDSAGPNACSSRFVSLFTDTENETMRSMVESADRRNHFRLHLVANTVATGNQDFILSRPVLVEWMFDVCNAFGFLPTTLHASVRLLDNFMARRRCMKQAWQLCAVACLFIAAKVEEAADRVPLLAELQPVCGDTYDAEMLKRMEVCVLSVLDWDPLDKGPMHFLAFTLRTMQRLRNECTAGDKPALPGITSAACPPALSHDPDADGTRSMVSPETVTCTPGRDHPITASSTNCPRRNCKRSRHVTESPDAEAEVVAPPAKTRKTGVAAAAHTPSSPNKYQTSAAEEPSAPAAAVDTDPSTRADEADDGALDEELTAIAQTGSAVLDLALYDPSIIAEFHPRVLSAAALLVSRWRCGVVDAAACEPRVVPLDGAQFVATWPSALARLTGVSAAEVGPCAGQLYRAMVQAQCAGEVAQESLADDADGPGSPESANGMAESELTAVETPLDDACGNITRD